MRERIRDNAAPLCNAIRWNDERKLLGTQRKNKWIKHVSMTQRFEISMNQTFQKDIKTANLEDELLMGGL